MQGTRTKERVSVELTLYEVWEHYRRLAYDYDQEPRWHSDDNTTLIESQKKALIAMKSLIEKELESDKFKEQK
ncbi:hypothetical protein MATR_37990 (plasmid) [Marivirga tractuosa]|uniref:Uncharacterized protein n=1 Tax=Marivirga tractuosa (strain ATCC 23168 / DSM 4126 / NBRC 15989 / NCIMB 1408 / VKM B-1430 / H-43) TaxID=643867 RepID=E4TW47_MARTH|nr:hypothetical protein [Marivirga tractuosa]ADR23769.1 hypothetical protein Ftrac_3803 [Marivirga tractuosa DSM 4126]BDD16974.1 hypothetical protein MATR_37990 [Marivirga tractuosa]